MITIAPYEFKAQSFNLSPAQAAVLRAFERPSHRHPWPTIREVCRTVGSSSTSVINYHIRKLIELGLLDHYSPNEIKNAYIYSSRCVGLTAAGEKWIRENRRTQ